MVFLSAEATGRGKSTTGTPSTEPIPHGPKSQQATPLPRTHREPEASLLSPVEDRFAKHGCKEMATAGMGPYEKRQEGGQSIQRPQTDHPQPRKAGGAPHHSAGAQHGGTSRREREAGSTTSHQFRAQPKPQGAGNGDAHLVKSLQPRATRKLTLRTRRRRQRFSYHQF